MGQPNTPDHLNEDQEPYAGKPVDNTPTDPDRPDPAGGEVRNQTPEVAEFGRRAVESGDPDGEDRPNGDPRTVGRPVGGGERSPEAPAKGGDEATAGRPDDGTRTDKPDA